MADIKTTLDNLMDIEGAKHVGLVDSDSGMLLGEAGSSNIDIELAAAGNSQVVRAKLATMKSLNISEEIEDILITLGTQYHIIRPIESQKGLFLYLVLSKAKANLALARRGILNAEKSLEM